MNFLGGIFDRMDREMSCKDRNELNCRKVVGRKHARLVENVKFSKHDRLHVCTKFSKHLLETLAIF